MTSGSDTELGNAVTEYQRAASDEQRIASLKKIASQVKHKALAEPTAISIIGLVTEAISYRGDVRDAALALLAYLVRRMHSQSQLSSRAVSAALNGIPNWPDTLTDLRKRGVPAEIRNQLQTALERPPSSGRATPSGASARPLSRMGGERRNGTAGGPRPASPAALRDQSGASTSTPVDNGLDPIYIASSSQLDQICRDMLPDFEGKESEHNWPRRDKNMTKLRQITKGNAPVDFAAAYIINFKVLFEGIVKCATSLRTTFSTNASQFIQEAAAAVGHGLDVYAGRLFEMAIKMCSDTKPIAAQNGNNTVIALISHVSWNKHVLGYVITATQDKNAKPREYAYIWLKIALEVHGKRKSVMEQGHGLDELEKCFRRGLVDPNPKVRETAKKIFWDFHAVFPTRGDAILSSLEERLQKSLNALNPAAGGSAGQALAPTAAAPVKAKALGNRPSIKDLMAAKRREAAMNRPQSALATMQTADSKPDVKKSGPSRPAAARPAQEATSGLSSAPVRPGRKVISRQVSRPEGLANADTDRPKTPFRAGQTQRPQSRAEEKKEGPRRPTAAKAAVPLRPAANVMKPATTNSLPASPEKMRDMTPSHRRPNSISEDSPITVGMPRLEPTKIGTPPRMSTPTSPRRFHRDSSPLHSHPSPSRMSTPAHVYEDPRSSPSLSPQSASGSRIPMSAHRATSSIDRGRKSVDLTPKLGLQKEATLTVSEGFSPVKMPLMELSNNEVNTPQTLAKDPRSAKLIDSGIVHMKTGKLDPHGYRKLHDAVMQNIDVLGATQYEELLFGLIQMPSSGQDNPNTANPSINGERILVQRLHLMSALAKSSHVQPYFPSVLRWLVHVLRHDARQESHTYWVAEGMLKEFAQITAASPNEACHVVLQQPQEMLNAVVLKCVALLVSNRAFDKSDGELIATLAELGGQAIANHKDVDARIQGHQLAQALGPDAIKQFLGEEKAGVAFMLYQNMKAGA